MAKTISAASIAEAADRAVKVITTKDNLQFTVGLAGRHLLVGRVLKNATDFKQALGAATTIASSVSRSIGMTLEPTVQFGKGYLIAGFINPDIIDFGGGGPAGNPGFSAPMKKAASGKKK